MRIGLQKGIALYWENVSLAKMQEPKASSAAHDVPISEA
jgi:hypothetical protein